MKRTAIACGVGGVSLAGLGALWYQSHYVLPPEPKLDVKLPSPNGYDTLQQACGLEVGEKEGIVTSPSRKDADQPLPGRLALLKANASSIEKLREALTQTYLNPTATINGDFKHYAKIREEARMLSFASKTYADAGNLPEASRCALDAIELGAKIPRGGTLITGLVGIACEAIGTKALAGIADKLDAPTARVAARRLEAIDGERPKYAEILTEESRFSRQSIRQMFARGPFALMRSQSLFGESSGELSEELPHEEMSVSERAKLFCLTAVLVYHGPKTTLKETDRYMGELAALSGKPWSYPRPIPQAPTDPLSRIMMPVFSQAEFKWVSARATNALLRTRLALGAYRQEKGAYPASLDALVSGGYLDALPSDPLSPARAPLGYKPGGEKFALWSVGPDAKDDGGKPIEMEGKRGYVDEGKPGDIVSGVNTW